LALPRAARRMSLRIFGNIPYTSSPIITRLITHRRTHAYLMVQRSAQHSVRLRGQSHSALQLLVQYYMRPRILAMSRGSFSPCPRVDSAFILQRCVTVRPYALG
jgi:16S rRNA A1518/A1519 N6-dimethyltransferase RsmA/KsgA/DIM1 with predicted DNA glycosylase/AP lyase activity